MLPDFFHEHLYLNVFQITQARSYSAVCRLYPLLPLDQKQVSMRFLHGNVRVDEHVRAGLRVVGDIQGDGTPATLLEAIHHGSAKGAISTQDQAFTGLLHL